MRHLPRTLALVTLSLVLAACSKVTVENYNKLEPGMPYAKVQELLGKPTRCNDILTVKNCVWGDDKSNINVSFVADQVVLFTSENIR